MSFSPTLLTPKASCNIEEQRECWEKKRNRIARELVWSEQTFCQQLDLVVTYFVEILKAKGTLRQDIRESIFSSIKSIHLINQSLLAHLEQGRFGVGFDDFCTNLNLYNTYIDNFQTAKKVLEFQVKKSKAFRRFKKLQEARSVFNQQKLEDLLALPLQRIQQYDRLLRDLTENTRPDNPEFRQLSKAVASIAEVAQHIQDNARSHDNILQLRRVQKQLKGRKTRILTPGRWYIREGWLKTVPPKGSEAKPKKFFLFSDVLLQAKPCSPIHPTSGGKLVCQQVYPLKECTVDKVFGHTKSQGGLMSLTFSKAKLLLMSDDQVDINDWHRSLCLAIGQLKSKRTRVQQREELQPLRSEPDPPHAPHSHGTKRPMERQDTAEAENNHSATKRLKPSQAPAASVTESSGFSCVIL